jgi:signal transduction histidine kinase
LLIDSHREIMERARTQVGNLAHALKTPLSVIANEAAAIDGEVGEKIREQSAVIGTQMNWYLERARTAAASVALGRATELAPVIGGLARVFAKLWQSRAVTLVYDVPSGLCFRGEKQDLEEMLGNLIDNAGKWAASQVSVTARLNEGPDLFVDVMIDDDGPGLAKDLRVEAMRRGRRLDETRPGTGLGLAIVADLAKLYGGQLMLEDSSLGGLRARLRLPALQSPS